MNTHSFQTPNPSSKPTSTLITVWHGLVEPSRVIVDRAKRRKARLLSSFLLCMFGLFLGINSLYAFSIKGYVVPLADLVGYLVLISAYIISRSRFSNFAALMMVLMFPLNTFSNILQNTTPNLSATLTFLIPGYILASIFLSPLGVAFYGSLISILIALLPIVAPNVVTGYPLIVGPLSASVLSILLLVIAMQYRDQIDTDHQQELKQTYDQTLEGWAHMLEFRDKETEGHSRRVTELTMELAHACGVAKNQLEHIYRGALLHDIGKLAIPDAVLSKRGRLNEEEEQTIQSHSQLALTMLSPIAFLKPALDIVAYHHERWDGKGYPSGLQGEQIPLPARIFAVADVWDALLSDRPYHSALTKDQAIQHLQEQSGQMFDPLIVKKFLALIA